MTIVTARWTVCGVKVCLGLFSFHSGGTAAARTMQTSRRVNGICEGHFLCFIPGRNQNSRCSGDGKMWFRASKFIEHVDEIHADFPPLVRHSANSTQSIRSLTNDALPQVGLDG
jgi:hypothetical protein